MLFPFHAIYTSLNLSQDDTKDEKAKEMARSRSIFFIDTAKAWDVILARSQVKMILDKLAPDLSQSSVKDLATFDRDVRIAAIADYNITSLLDAGNTLEETDRAKAKASEASLRHDSSGLQLLASTVEQIHRGQKLVEPGKKYGTSTTKKTYPLPKDSSSSNYYAQRILPQARPEKPRHGDYSADGVLQVQPVTPKARNRANDAYHSANSKSKAATPTGPVWHHFHVSSPAKARGKASHASSPRASSQQKSEDGKHKSVSAATQPELGPPFEGNVNRSATKDPTSFTDAQKPPALESAAKVRAEPARKMHGPVPGYMLGSVGSFSRFSVEPSKKPQNPRPLAAKPISGPERMAVSTSPNDTQPYVTASVLNAAPDGSHKEHQESQSSTARRASAEKTTLPPMLQSETAVGPRPSFSAATLTHGEYAAEPNRPNAPGSRRQSFGAPPPAQSVQVENGAYPPAPMAPQPRQGHQRQQSFESAPYLEARKSDRPPAMYGGSQGPLPSMNTQLGQYSTYHQANPPQPFGYGPRSAEGHPPQSVASSPLAPQPYVYPSSPANVISPGTAPGSYAPPLAPLQPQPYSAPAYDPRGQYYQPPTAKSYPLPPPPPPPYSHYQPYAPPPSQYQVPYHGPPGPNREEHRLPPIQTFSGPPGSAPPPPQSSFSQFRHYAPAESSPTKPQQGPYNG